MFGNAFGDTHSHWIAPALPVMLDDSILDSPAGLYHVADASSPRATMAPTSRLPVTPGCWPLKLGKMMLDGAMMVGTWAAAPAAHSTASAKHAATRDPGSLLMRRFSLERHRKAGPSTMIQAGQSRAQRNLAERRQEAGGWERDIVGAGCMDTQQMLYLSAADVASVGLDPRTIIGLLESAFREKGHGRVEMPPKPGIHTRPDAFIHAMPAYIPAMRAAGVKWVSGYPENRAAGLPYISGLIVLNDVDTGLPSAVMDCTWITAYRTAAASALSARYLARPESEHRGHSGVRRPGAHAPRGVGARVPGEAGARVRHRAGRAGAIRRGDGSEDRH